jgi:hypothetical protein
VTSVKVALPWVCRRLAACHEIGPQLLDARVALLQLVLYAIWLRRSGHDVHVIDFQHSEKHHLCAFPEFREAKTGCSTGIAV